MAPAPPDQDVGALLHHLADLVDLQEGGIGHSQLTANDRDTIEALPTRLIGQFQEVEPFRGQFEEAWMRQSPFVRRASRPAFDTELPSRMRINRPLAASGHPRATSPATSRDSHCAVLRKRPNKATSDTDATPIASAHAAVPRSPAWPKQ